MAISLNILREKVMNKEKEKLELEAQIKQRCPDKV